MRRRLTRSTLFPYTTLFRSGAVAPRGVGRPAAPEGARRPRPAARRPRQPPGQRLEVHVAAAGGARARAGRAGRSEEHTSELQSQSNLVCRLLLEKKKYKSAY